MNPTTAAHLATLIAGSETLTRRMAHLASLVPFKADQLNARECYLDAYVCLTNARDGKPWPASCPEGADATLWRQAAERWATRAGQHLYGHSTPEGW